MKRISAIVLRAAGVNCNKETVLALKMAGAYKVDEIHINVLRKNRKLLDTYNIMVIPGGFTYGDSVSAGKILANEIKFILFDRLKRFVKQGKIIIGICNGFQVLIKSGLLAGDGKTQTFSLIENDSRRFECRWVYLRTNPKSIFFKNLPDIIYLPVAHNEGKFVSKTEIDIKRLQDTGRVALNYCAPDGDILNVQYPFNPNGSKFNIAGILNTDGNVLGVMPHPERFIFPQHHPNYNHLIYNNITIIPYGIQIFKNALHSA